MSTVSPTVLSTVHPTVLSTIASADTFRYTFNGTNMYATMPPWAAQGKPRRYSVSFNANAVSTGTEQHILSGTEGGVELAFYLHATLPVVAIRYRSDTGTQASEGVFDVEDEIVAGEDYNLEVINLGTGSQILLNGKDVDITAFEASDGIQPALTHIGAKHDGTSFFGGTIWASMLYDESPIHNTWANIGNGDLYGELEQAIVLEGDFEIEWEGIVQASICWVITSADGTSGIRVSQSNIQVFNNGTGGVIANTSLVVGQHYNGKLEVLSGIATIYVDDAEVASGAQAINSWNMSLVTGSATQHMSAGQAFQNIIARDLDNNLTWDYTLTDPTVTAEIGNQRFRATPTSLFPTTFGLTGADVTSWSVDASDNVTLVLTSKPAITPVEIVTYKYTTPLTEGPANTWTGNVPGLYKLVDGPDGGIVEFTEQGPVFQADSIVNSDPSTQGNYLNQPLWDTVANFGDGARYGELEQAIVLEGDVDISWDCIKSDPESGVWTVILGGTANNRDYILYRGATDPTFPDRLQVYDSDSNAILATTGALSGVAAGQHYHGRLTVIDEGSGAVARMYIDGVQVAVNVPASYAGFSFSRIGGADGLGKLPIGSALQNIVITQPNGPNYSWDYGLDEGAGTDIVNSDPSTPGYNGSWTSADWQYIPEYSNNGMWTDTDWTFIANNTRRYPMNDGPNGGGQFRCIDGTGTEQPANAATIVGYDEGAWD